MTPEPSKEDLERARGVALELNMCCSNPIAFAPECQCLDCVLRENTAQVVAQALAELRAEGERKLKALDNRLNSTESSLAFHKNFTIPDLRKEKSALEERVKLLERACSKTNEEVCQSLGKVLGYPWFKDDQKNFPDATEENGVCVGEHVAESISEEAAKKIVALEERVRKLEAHKPDYSDPRYETLNDRIRENRELSEINKRQKEEISRLKSRNEELEAENERSLESDYRMDEIINLVNDLLGERYSIKNIIKHIKDAV